MRGEGVRFLFQNVTLYSLIKPLNVRIFDKSREKISNVKSITRVS